MFPSSDDEPRQRPLLLQRTPYGFQQARYAGLNAAKAVKRGWNVWIQDVRGRHGSDGTFDPYIHEGRDGVDAVDWALASGVTDGRIVLYGASYSGAAALATARADSSRIRGLALMQAPVDLARDWAYRGGAFNLGERIAWTDILRKNLDPYPEAEGGGPGGSAGKRSVLDTAYAKYLCALAAAVEEESPWAMAWWTHPAITRARSFGESVSQEHENAQLTSLNVPSFLIAGWWDPFLAGMLDLWHGCRMVPGSRLVVGPWTHGDLTGIQGGVDYGFESDARHRRLGRQILDWAEDVIANSPAGRVAESVFDLGDRSWKGQEWDTDASQGTASHIHEFEVELISEYREAPSFSSSIFSLTTLGSGPRVLGDSSGTRFLLRLEDLISVGSVWDVECTLNEVNGYWGLRYASPQDVAVRAILLLDRAGGGAQLEVLSDECVILPGTDGCSRTKWIAPMKCHDALARFKLVLVPSVFPVFPKLQEGVLSTVRVSSVTTSGRALPNPAQGR